MATGEEETARDHSLEPPDDFVVEAVERLRRRGPAFGRYRVNGQVARGGMGIILRVWDEDLHRELAMKVALAPEGPRARAPADVDSRALARFLEEAQIAGQLDHPGIVPVHELGLDDEGRVYFTMPLVAGRNLQQVYELVRAGEEGWNPTRALSVVLKVCDAMSYAHAKGVVHRDLKPANVMVGRFGEVYVMDWGLARLRRSADPRREGSKPATAWIHTDRGDAAATAAGSVWQTMDGEVVGTPAYMSPEQAGTEVGEVGPLSDVYSVGAMLYDLLAGHVPYAPPGSGATAASVWDALRRGPPEAVDQRAPGAPAELCAICEKAMAWRPEERYPSMAELAQDLRAYLEGRVVRAYETGALAEFRKWVARNRSLALTSMAAVLVIVLGTTTASVLLRGKNVELARLNEVSRSNEQRALASERVASERAARLLRLSDTRRLQELRQEAERLWPALPGTVPRYEAWLASARDLAARLSEHEASLAALREQGRPAESAEGEADAGEAWSFATPELRWQHDVQRDLVEGLRAFVEPDGELRDVERRLEFARTVEERSVGGAAARARWREATASISDRGASPQYDGLVLRPQLGLLPLGRDPQSELWEFAHLQTGEPARRDPATGRLELEERSGLVLVLVPGGRLRMGCQADDPGAPNYDPEAPGNAQPVEELDLAPYFLSKYEMTQGQWQRFTGSNPSIYVPGGALSTDLLHPVEQVSWEDCRRVLGQLGLELPTEAQWEYAVRAGTGTRWWPGDEREDLVGCANLADQSAARFDAPYPAIAEWPELDDGYPVHAPVDALRPNPFGLHHMTGNVLEWCRDRFGFYADNPARAGDGLRSPEDPRYRINRGGGFGLGAAWARSAARNNSSPDTRNNQLGVRPARAVER